MKNIENIYDIMIGQSFRDINDVLCQIGDVVSNDNHYHIGIIFQIIDDVVHCLSIKGFQHFSMNYNEVINYNFMFSNDQLLGFKNRIKKFIERKNAIKIKTFHLFCITNTGFCIVPIQNASAECLYYKDKIPKEIDITHKIIEMRTQNPDLGFLSTLVLEKLSDYINPIYKIDSKGNYYHFDGKNIIDDKTHEITNDLFKFSEKGLYKFQDAIGVQKHFFNEQKTVKLFKQKAQKFIESTKSTYL